MNIKELALQCGFKDVIEPPCDYYKATEQQLNQFAQAVIEQFISE